MLVDLLEKSNYIVVYTGAGMSTESGLPDFRSAKTGPWEKEDPALIASTEALNRDVENFFQFYRERVLGVKDCKPHEGHDILAKWEKDGLIQSIITQNVDGFHSVAGSENVMELHGTLQKVHCQSCKKEYGNDMYESESFYCTCGGKLRPSVVLFGEELPEEAFMQAVQESEKADLFIVLGSSLTVTPANQFPLLAKENGAKLLIVNMEPTHFDDYADIVINDQKIGDVLAEIDSYLVRKISVDVNSNGYPTHGDRYPTHIREYPSNTQRYPTQRDLYHAHNRIYPHIGANYLSKYTCFSTTNQVNAIIVSKGLLGLLISAISKIGIGK